MYFKATLRFIKYNLLYALNKAAPKEPELFGKIINHVRDVIGAEFTFASCIKMCSFVESIYIFRNVFPSHYYSRKAGSQIFPWILKNIGE